MELYDKAEFAANDITLQFHKMRPIVYTQSGNTFVSSLSILDVMMFNDRTAIMSYLREFDLL